METNEMRIVRRGEVYMADLNPYTGSEQGGYRPVVILTEQCGELLLDNDNHCSDYE